MFTVIYVLTMASMLTHTQHTKQHIHLYMHVHYANTLTHMSAHYEQTHTLHSSLHIHMNTYCVHIVTGKGSAEIHPSHILAEAVRFD